MNPGTGIMKLDVFPSCGHIGASEASDAALAVQMILNALTVRYDGWTLLDLTGAVDEATAAALHSFREVWGLAHVPGVDALTWNALASEYAVLREEE